MPNLLENNKTPVFIVILAVGSISGFVTAQFVMGLDGDTLKNLLGGCIYDACKDTKITGNVTDGILAGCIYGACKNVEIKGEGQGQPTPNTATLIVTKDVVGCDGGVACPAPEDFTIKITGNDPSPSTVHDDGTGTKVTIGPGEFAVTEAPTEGFLISFSGDCDGKISAGDTKNCTVINTKKATLTVIKQCLPGSPDVTCPPVSDFKFTLSGNNPSPATFDGSEGTRVTIGPGQYKVSEEQPAFADDITVGGKCVQTGDFEASGTIAAGETQLCSIINTRLR